MFDLSEFKMTRKEYEEQYLCKFTPSCQIKTVEEAFTEMEKAEPPKSFSIKTDDYFQMKQHKLAGCIIDTKAKTILGVPFYLDHKHA